MPIFVNCVCGKRLQGRDEDAGRQTRCPFCGKIITLPQSSNPEPPAQELPPPSSLPPRGSPSREFLCRVCRGSFVSSEVYSEAGAYICKNCFDRETEEEDRGSRGRWDRLNLPGKKRTSRPRRYEDDDDDIVRPSRRRRRGSYVNPYLTEAILVTLFCCLPFGIVAIIKASEVNTCLARGDEHGAEEASDSAKVWCLLSFGLGLAFGIIAFLGMVASGGRF